MTGENFTAGIGFRLLQAGDRPDERRRYVLDRGARPPATLLEVAGAPFDAVNTEVQPVSVERLLRPLLDVPRMSTMAIGAVLNRAVASMPAGHAFVNVGTWHGYTLLAAMAGNPDAVCVGIDDFSEFGGPREEFGERFERARSDRHSFHDMDYREYLAEVHEGPIGAYLYDGENTYEGEYEALTGAERWFADGCLLIADDTNRSHRRQAMFDFARDSDSDWSLVLDARTAANRHPTYWNGTLVMQKGGNGPAPSPHMVGHEVHEPPAAPLPEGGRPSVSVVVVAADGGSTESAEEALRSQTWRDLEVLAADPAATLQEALHRTSGDLVAFVDTAAELRPDAVELSVAYPAAVRFARGRMDDGLEDRLATGVQAGRDVGPVLPAATPYVIASDKHALPATLTAGPAVPLAPAGGRLRELDDDAAIRALDAACTEGNRHFVVLWNRFDWFDERSGFSAHVSEHWSPLLATERVRVFAARDTA